MVAINRFGGDLESTEFRWRPRAAGFGLGYLPGIELSDVAVPFGPRSLQT
jgi:hypothetical protein